MTDYKCPNCGGGFPASAAVDDECPWCARGMEGGSGSSPTTPRLIPPEERVIDRSPPGTGLFDNPLDASPVDLDLPVNVPRMNRPSDYTGRTGGWR